MVTPPYYYHFRHHKSTRPSPEEMRGMPLHCADRSDDPPLLRLDKVAELPVTKPHLAKLFADMRPFVEDHTLYQRICTDKAGSPRLADITDDDHSKMLLSAKFRQMMASSPYSRARRYGVVFTVAEKAKNRRRLIMWPKQLNEELKQHFPKLEINIADGVQYAKDLAPGMAAIACDLVKSFWQVPLAQAVQPYFAYKYADETYCHTVLPMGVVFAPALMQAITEILADTGVADVTTHVHIDNVRFVGKPDAVREAYRRFKERCDTCNVTLGREVNKYHPNYNASAGADAPSQPRLEQLHTVGEFCGTVTDYRNATIRVSDKVLEKIRSDLAAVRKPTATIHDIMVLFGRLFFATRVLRVPLSPYYFVLKYYRRAMHRFASTGDANAPAELWSTAQTLLYKWVSAITANRPVRHHPDSAQLSDSSRVLHLATDASVAGWGAVLIDDATGEVASTGAKWSAPHNNTEINALETAAVRNGLVAFADRIRAVAPHALLVYVDNTSAKHAIQKGYSASEQMNAAILEVCKSLDTLPSNIHVHAYYISTLQNPADEPSRGRAVNFRKAREMGAMGRKLAPLSYSPRIS